MPTPIRIHPENPKIFEFRDKPLVLITATEHYGAVMNRPFKFERYLADADEKHITLTRLFMLYREQQASINPYSTCKPESPDYIAPFQRTGPGRALDAELKYDLDLPNPEFFDRLHRFLSLASDYGIIVEVVLLSNTYSPGIWALNPLNARNNVNGLEEINFQDYMSQRNPGVFERQVAHVRKIVEETNRYDNVIYEICNEPGGKDPSRDDSPSVEEVNGWLSALIEVVRQTEANLPNAHLIAGQGAFVYDPREHPADLSFRGLDYDVVNVHPLPDTRFGGKSYDLGAFMSKQLALTPLRDFCLATYPESKPLNLDEDNAASQYKDVGGWTIHRKRAWTTLLSGAHYDYIDFSIINYCEAGTPESQRHIRSWMKYLSDFMHSIDLVNARPLAGLLEERPSHTLEAVFGVEGKDYCIYLADKRELAEARDLPAINEDEAGPGDPIGGRISLGLPDGTYRVACFDPETGLYSPAMEIRGGRSVCLDILPFTHDTVVRITQLSPVASP